MFYIPKIGGYLKILANNQVKDFVDKHFCEYFEYMKEKLYSKLCEKYNIRKLLNRFISS